MDKLIPATEEHIRAVRGEPFAASVIAVTGIDDTGPYGVAAIYPEAGRMVLVFKLTDAGRANIRRHAKTILKGAKYLLKQASKYSLPVQTTADPFPRAVELLLHLGFRPVGPIHYEWRP